jgi:hypothetical protein
VVGVPVREENGVEAIEVSAQRLRSEIRCRVNHDGMPIELNQQRRPRALIVRIA